MVKAEHCRSQDSNVPFHTTNYGITTTPAKEWEITTTQNESLADMRHGRRLPNIEELLESDIAKRAGLTWIEVLVVVLYTGPMVNPLRPPSSPVPPLRCTLLAAEFKTIPQQPVLSPLRWPCAQPLR